MITDDKLLIRNRLDLDI